MKNMLIKLFFSKAFSTRRMWFFIYTTFLCLVANTMAIDIPIVVPFLVGNIAFSIILFRLGFTWSLLSLIIVCLPLESPLVIGNCVLQLIFLMWLRLNLKQSLWPIFCVYSISIFALDYLLGNDSLKSTTMLWIIATMLHCCLFALCTKTALMLNTITITPLNQKQQSLRLQLSHRIGLYSAVPCTILIAFILQAAIGLHLSSQLQFYQDEQNVFVSKIQRHIERYISNTELVASLGHKNIDTHTLQTLNGQEPEFISTLVTDKNGIVTQFYKAGVSKLPINNVSVIDRSYFSQPKTINTSFVSESFKGRALGEDLLFAVSAPIYLDGIFDGVVEVSVVLDTLTKTLAFTDNISPNTIILDRQSKKIWGSNHLGELGDVWNEHAIFEPYHPSLLQQLFFNTAKPIVFTTDARYILVKSQLDKLNWSTIHYQETTPFVVRYLIYLSIAMLSSLLLLKYITSLSGRLVHNYTETLEKITEFTHQLGTDKRINQPLHFNYSAREFEILTQSINNLNERVINSREAMMNSMAEVKALNNQLEDRVKERTLQLEQERDRANQLAAIKTRFLANMSHEIRTPITIIKGFTEELLNHTNGETQQVLNRIQQNTLHLQNVINDILDTAKIDEGKMTLDLQPIGLRDFLVNSIDSSSQIAISKGLSIQCAIEDISDLYVMVDPFRLQQILLNLLSNAVKFTANGTIILKAHKSPDNTCTVQIIDEGIGMSDEQQLTLFAAFKQADVSISRDYGGTGLGLYISKQLADAMGLLLTVKSKLGQGSTFTLTLPTTNTRPISKPLEHVNSTTFTQRVLGGTLLIVDDVEDIRQLIAVYVKPLKMKILFAENGKQAVDIVDKDQPDIIIMDQQMPIMDGYQAAQMLRNRHFTKPIISLSADVFKEEHSPNTVSPFNAVLNKPIDKTQLLQTITRCFDKHQTNASKPDNDDVKTQDELDMLNEIKNLRLEYLDSLRAIPDQLILLASSADHDQVKNLFHKIKGTSACLGLDNVSESAKQAEIGLKAGENLHDVCKKFNSSLNKLITDSDA